MMPTASAIVADIIEVAMGNSKKLFKHLTLEPRNKNLIAKIDDLMSRFYIRLRVSDKPGVFAQITSILAKHEISLSGVLQHEEQNSTGTVPAIIITHQTQQRKVTEALKDFEKLEIVKNKPVCIRIVDIPQDSD
jgi:homoserine dehydrogenase